MKDYIKPYIEEEEIQLDDIIALSNLTSNVDLGDPKVTPADNDDL